MGSKLTESDQAKVEWDSFDQEEALVMELHRRGVCHLARLQTDKTYSPLAPVDLIMSLARHPAARLHSALILLFLRNPNLSACVPQALSRLDGSSTDHLRLYYQAAVYLQRELEAQLRPYIKDWLFLPDLFSTKLGLPAVDQIPSSEALQALGKVHQRLSGWAINWAGSYRQHIPLFLRQLQRVPHGTVQP
jgi:hypothetical protein